MVEGIIGRKIGMTQVFSEDGKVVPVTVIEAGPCRVLQIKTVENDGYEAVQLGFGVKKKPNKPEKQHAAKAGAGVPVFIREFKPIGEIPALGAEVNVSIFQVGEYVDVSGITKGKGFQGVVKRYRFAGGPRSRGSMFHRAPGAIGCRAWPGKIHKGKRMAGHMGARRRTIQNLKIISVEPENNLLLVQGATPGWNNGILEIIKSRKRRQS